MKTEKMRKIIITALMMAIICVATFVVQIPIPATGGYVNLGDCFVLIAGYLLGGLYGSIAAGIGSTLADILAGYMQYAPATLIIKGLMAIAFFYLYKVMNKVLNGKFSLVSKTVSAVAAEIIMVGGYFFYEAVILKYGLSAATSIVPNLMQGFVAIVAYVILSAAIDKIKFKI